MKGRCVQTHITSAFRKLGFSIGKHPFLYCIIPLVVSALLSIGFYWIHLVKDAEFLFNPRNGRSLREREAVESLFPPSNYSSNVVSSTRLQFFATVVLIPKDNLSVLRENIFDDAVEIDKIIYNITIPWKNRTYSLKDVCMKSFNGDCAKNDVLNLKGKMESLRKRKLLIKFPVNIDDISLQHSIYGFGFGGVTLDDDHYVLDSLAMRLIYLLDHTTTEKKEISRKWEESFLEVVSKLTARSVYILRASGSSIDNEMNRITETSLPLIKFIAPLTGMFVIISSMTSNCVTSKPWVGIAAFLPPVLGVVSAFGMLIMLGVQYIDLNIVILFLLIGIGLDDSFIMLAAWRRTDPKLSVEERLSQAYSEAAVSITITSLTNCLSLCIGIGSPHGLTRIFCIYTGISIIFTYIYQITFFGGIMAISGIGERKGLHSVLCVSIKEKKVPNYSVLKLVCFGCTKIRKDGSKEKPSVASNFGNSFLTTMLTTGGKFIIMVTFLVYLLSSSYCLTYATEDFDYKNLLNYDSYASKYLTAHYKYFTQYSEPIHVVINETLDYSSKNVQDNIEEILNTLTETPNIIKDLSYSWLNYYLQQANDERFYLAYYGYNISDPNDFTEALRDVFLKFFNARTFQQHIKFNEDRTKIVSSRFFIVGKDVGLSSYAESKRLITSLWKKVDSIPYTVYVHSVFFPVCDALMEIVPSFITTLLSAIGLITVCFFIIIPNLLCTVSIFLTVVSIQIGVIGYMSVWDVPINPISMVCIMVSVGLSVDYAAHVSYAYLSSKEENPDQKTINSLRLAGYPVIQGCVSTMIGVGVLAFGPTHTMLVFSKVITLVLLISIFHGIFVIPFALNSCEMFWRHIRHSLERRQKNEPNFAIRQM